MANSGSFGRKNLCKFCAKIRLVQKLCKFNVALNSVQKLCKLFSTESTGTKTSIRLRQNINVAWLKSGELPEHFRHQRVRVFKAIGFCPQDHDGKRQVFDFLLVRQSFIHREKDIKFFGVRDEAQELSIFDARPASARDGQDFVAGQIAPETRGQTFIQKNSHSGGLWDFFQHGIGGFFQKGDGLLARNRGKIIEENIKAVTGFDVVKERANGDARACKARLAAHDLRVNLHNGTFLHGDN